LEVTQQVCAFLEKVFFHSLPIHDFEKIPCFGGERVWDRAECAPRTREVRAACSEDRYSPLFVLSESLLQTPRAELSACLGRCFDVEMFLAVLMVEGWRKRHLYALAPVCKEEHMGFGLGWVFLTN